MRLFSLQTLLAWVLLQGAQCIADPIQIKSCWASLPQGEVELIANGVTTPLSLYGGAFGATLTIERPESLELKITNPTSKQSVSQKIAGPIAGTEFRLVISGNSLETAHGWFIPTEDGQFPWGSLMFINASSEMGRFCFDNDKVEINRDTLHLMPFIATKRNGIYLGIEHPFKKGWLTDYSTKIVIHPLQRMIMVFGPKEAGDDQTPLSMVMEFKPAPTVAPLLPNPTATSP